MPTPKISVIVPVYNSEKFLRKSLDSIRFQTYSNLEIICVDDESTDNSLEILKEYSKTDKRFVILSKKNGGSGAARNLGIALSTGDYISFIDSDDWILLDLYKNFIDLVTPKTDFFMFNVESYVAGENDIVPKVFFEMTDWKTKSENDYSYLDCKSPFSRNLSACNRIYKASFLKENDILFPEGLKFEDAFFSTKCLLRAKSIIINPNIFYRYRNFASKSISMTFDEKTFDIFTIMDLIEREIENCGAYEHLKYALFQYKFFSYFNNYFCCPEELKHKYFDEMKNRLKFAVTQNLDLNLAKRLKNYPIFELIVNNDWESFEKNNKF